MVAASSLYVYASDRGSVMIDPLETLLDEAGEATDPPPEPLGGIPKQWLPRFLRDLLRLCVLPFVLLDGVMQRVARWLVRPPLKRGGRCRRRGNCCHYILIRQSKSLIGVLFYLWYTQVQGFYRREQEPVDYQGKRVYLMGCRHLKRDGSCAAYRLRPSICRSWPVIDHFGFPKILKGCGFYPVHKNRRRRGRGGKREEIGDFILNTTHFMTR